MAMQAFTLCCAVLVAVTAHGADTESDRWFHGISEPATSTTGITLRHRVQRDGFARLKQLLPKEQMGPFAKAVQVETEAFTRRCKTCSVDDVNDIQNNNCQGCQVHDTTPAGTTKSFLRARNVHRKNSLIRKTVMSPSVAGVAATALGVDKVRLYQTVAFFKQPGDVESSWHQDQVAAPFSGDKFVTVWIALDDLGREQSPLTFANGSHIDVAGSPSLQTVPLERRVSRMAHLSDHDIKQWYKMSNAMAMDAGDASLHLGWTFHRADANRGSTVRRALAASFIADGTHFYNDLLHLGVASGDRRGVELHADDGSTVLVQLITDDIDTWMPWILSASVIPGAPVSKKNCPYMYPSVNKKKKKGKKKIKNKSKSKKTSRAEL